MPEETFEQAPSFEKADVFRRVVAVVIDGIIGALISGIFSTIIPIPIVSVIIGSLMGGGYILVRDGLNIEALGGQSVGKKLMQLKVTGSGGPVDYVVSIKRNVTLAFSSLCSPILIIPILGWLVMLIVSIAQLVLILVELYKVVSEPEGLRIGDTIAETKVVDA